MNGADKKKAGEKKESESQVPRRTPKAIRELIIQMAKDNGWGLGRILGELKKLGIKSVCKSTVRNILKEYGYDPGPDRSEGSWSELLKIHAKTLWACDFISKRSGRRVA